jgi:hypothetical protein
MRKNVIRMVMVAWLLLVASSAELKAAGPCPPPQLPPSVVR